MNLSETSLVAIHLEMIRIEVLAELKPITK